MGAAGLSYRDKYFKVIILSAVCEVLPSLIRSKMAGYAAKE